MIWNQKSTAKKIMNGKQMFKDKQKNYSETIVL